jgi:hypothetical protein
VLFPGNVPLSMWLHRLEAWCGSLVVGPVPTAPAVPDAVCRVEGTGCVAPASSAVPGTQFLDVVLTLFIGVPMAGGSGCEEVTLLPASALAVFNNVRRNAVAGMATLAAWLRPVCVEAGVYEAVPAVADVVESQLVLGLWLSHAAAGISAGLRETLAQERVMKASAGWSCPLVGPVYWVFAALFDHWCGYFAL